MKSSDVRASKIVIASSRPVRFSKGYSKAKVFGAIATGLWVFGLVEVVIADIFQGSTWRPVVISVGAVALLGAGALAFLHAGTRSWDSSTGCDLNGKPEGGCGQPGCDLAGGGCFAKLDREVSNQISRMEQEKLALLLRKKVGIDLLFPLFWFLVGLKIVFSYVGPPIIGGFALILGSVALVLVRLYLGQIVFE